jgi:hypothetical protein
MHRDMMRLTLEIVVRCLFSADVSNDVDVGEILSNSSSRSRPRLP